MPINYSRDNFFNDLQCNLFSTDVFFDAKNSLRENYITLYENEISLVHYYTDIGYRDLNCELRDDTSKFDYLAYERALNYSLDTLVAVNLVSEYSGIVYRSSNFVSAEKYKKGDIVTELSFYSTGKNLNKILQYHGDEVLFRIKSKSGVQIERFSKHSVREEEVLFRSKARFKVTDRFLLDSRVNIYLEEIDNVYEYDYRY